MSVATKPCRKCGEPAIHGLCSTCGKARAKAYRVRDKMRPDLKRKRRAEKMAKAMEQKRNATEAQIRDKALRTGIPVEVFKPYLEWVLTSCKQHTRTGEPGISVLAEWTDIDDRVFSRVLTGYEGVYTVTVDVADRVCQHADFTLDELTERALEWADVTGDPWPFGYR